MTSKQDATANGGGNAANAGFLPGGFGAALRLLFKASNFGHFPRLLREGPAPLARLAIQMHNTAEIMRLLRGGKPLVFISSFPRSGNTWIRYLLADAFLQIRGVATATELPVHPDKIVPGFLLQLDCPAGWERPGARRSGEDARDVSANAGTIWGRAASAGAAGSAAAPPFRGCKHVYLYRSPEDALVSLFHFDGHHKQAKFKAAAGVDAFCRANLPSWEENVASYLRAEEEGYPVLFVPYELVLQYPAEILSHLLRWLGVRHDGATVERAVSNMQFNKMREVEARSLSNEEAFFFRRGCKGSGRAELQPCHHGHHSGEDRAIDGAGQRPRVDASSRSSAILPPRKPRRFAGTPPSKTASPDGCRPWQNSKFSRRSAFVFLRAARKPNQLHERPNRPELICAHPRLPGKQTVAPPADCSVLAGLLGAALAVLFLRSFLPHQILFANDGPLGAMVQECNRLPGRFLGTWRNYLWIGLEAPSAAPTLSAVFGTLFQPVLFLKFYAPATLFFLGFSAWLYFRQLEFSPPVCVLGGIAAGLNMHFFSTACWGLGAWNVSAGMIFLALAALSAKSIKPAWARAVLAGLAVGMNLMEGYDVGAILSIYVGVFVLFRAFSEESGFARKTLSALRTEFLVIVFAGLIAAHTIHSLVGTQIEGIAGTGQDVETKELRWNFATQWSLPKVETLRLVTPGLFGYRLAANISSRDKSSAYWGLVGQDPRIPQLRSDDPQVRAKVVAQMAAIYPITPDQQKGLDSTDRPIRQATAAAIIQHFGFLIRHSGTGEYAGVLAALLALFALANSCRGPNTPFSPTERRAVWFWGVAALVSMLAAWGRHGFLYALLYRLPYFSTIRNPVKFLHPFHIIWIILAGYGLEVLHRRYLLNTVRRTASLSAHLQSWWSRAAGFEKKWVGACALVLAASAAGWALLLFCSQSRLVPYLANRGFQVWAPKMAGFCAGEAAWFLGFLFLAAGALAIILSGAWSGARAKMAWICLGAILVLDLGRTDQPWIHYFDYEKKYAPNAVTDFLAAKKPYEQRVIGRFSPRRLGSSNSRTALGPLYNNWEQNDFPYRDIQCLDFAEMPRMPEMDDAYLHNFEIHGDDSTNPDLWPAARLWELTGTRYILMGSGIAPMLNKFADPAQRGFHVVMGLRIAPKEAGQPFEDVGDMTVASDPGATNAIIEYNHVLPRAKLFAYWETPTNGEATLATLLSSNFIPAQTVLLWTNTPVTQAAGDPKADAGTVEITDYHARAIKLRAAAKLPAVLLLNERFAPSWSVLVDQQPARLLRCNYIMRGVFLTPGEHTVEFRYHPSLTTLYVSLGGWAAGLLLAGCLVWRARRA